MSKIKRHIFGESLHLGLLVLRLGVGIQLAMHGWPKMTGGMEKWEKLGKNMEMLGIDFFPAFWGFMAAFAEFGGGILIAVGLFTRPASFLLAFTMLVATVRHVSEEGAEWLDGAHAFELMVVFIALYLTGPGRYSIDRRIHPIA